MKVKIIGAGSIGNHLAQASRRMGWEIVVVDTDPKSLVRMREEIYPKRYGAWDDEIKLFLAGEEPKCGFDIIMVGTPPDVRMKVATEALNEKPRLLHLEKPMCTPNLEGVGEFCQLQEQYDFRTLVTVGYNHSVSEGIEETTRILKQGMIGEVITIDVEFREHWRGIFAAHPWIAGPHKTYLGYWQRGGGAGGEHSHALHLLLYIAHLLHWGGIKELKAMFDMYSDKNSAFYDRVASFLIETEYGGNGRVIQDVVTYPTSKFLRIQGENGFIEWHCNNTEAGDLLRYYRIGDIGVSEKVFLKKRPDDFYREMQHYEKLLAGEIDFRDSPLCFDHGLGVMFALKNAYSQVYKF